MRDVAAEGLFVARSLRRHFFEVSVGDLTYPEHRRRMPGRDLRAGLATVEFALCLPMVLTIVFASIELSSMIFLKLALKTSAYDAARLAATPSGTAADAVIRGTSVLSQRGIKQGTVQVTPSNLQSLSAGDPFTVTATAPISANRVINQWFFNSGNFSTTCVMVKEGH